MIMMGFFSKHIKRRILNFKTRVFDDTVTSYIGTERILSYVGVFQNEDIFVKRYNRVFS